MSADCLVVISGCSGGGKSTLLAELAARGYATVAEPGRRIIARERATGGGALPWLDMAGFARRAITMARGDLAAARGLTFFDRGLVDAAVAMETATGEPAAAHIGDAQYHRTVFLAPPWPAIFDAADDRPHGLSAAIAEYDRLAGAYPALGYAVSRLPRADVGTRADFVLAMLAAQRPIDE